MANPIMLHKYIFIQQQFRSIQSFAVWHGSVESLIFFFSPKKSFDLIAGEAQTKFKAEHFHFLRGRACVSPLYG